MRRHGHAGTKPSAEYRIWGGLWTRCTNQKHITYPKYGARGIYVDPRWKDFLVFYADMGPRPGPKHSIDRIDNDGPYSPENCRWASLQEQQRNQRRHQQYVVAGRSQLLCEWAEETGIPLKTLYDRIHCQGWSLERAMTEPIKKPGQATHCRRGHDLEQYGRWEERRRRCILCKKKYDRVYRKVEE